MSEYEIAAGCTIAALTILAAAALVRWLVSNPRGVM